MSVLEGILNEETPANGVVVDEDQLMEFVVKTLTSIQDSVGSLHIGVRILNERISMLEKYTGYLMEKDPEMGPKLKDLIAKADEQAGKV
jgi:hypothetical protein